MENGKIKMENKKRTADARGLTQIKSKMAKQKSKKERRKNGKTENGKVCEVSFRTCSEFRGVGGISL